MKNHSASFVRSTPKRDAIAATMRGEIATGRYSPGERLPKHTQLARRFGVSVLTVQRAMDRLAQEGFIEAQRSRGTFVRLHPPHLNRYALVFAHDPTDLEAGGWSHHYATLANEATKIQQAEGRQLECFYGIHGPVDTPAYQRLLAQTRTHQFAGLIFASHPGRLIDTPLLRLPDVPRVAIMGDDNLRGVIPQVRFDNLAWFERAAGYLATCGRRRVAFVRLANHHFLLGAERVRAILAKHRLVTRPWWNLPLPLWSDGAQHIVRLLMQTVGERPDALVITDDNIVEPAVAGLLAAGVRVPDDMTVVAHANFPRRAPRGLPLQWLGYDNRRAMQAAIFIIDQQCRGKKPPVTTTIPPVFEEELVHQQLAMERRPSR